MKFFKNKNDFSHKILLTVLIIYSTLFFIYGIINLLTAKPLIGIIELCISLLMITINYYTLVVRGRSNLSIAMINVITMTLCTYLYVDGGINATGIFWCFAMPPIYLSIQGRRKGMIWILIYVFIIFTLFILSLFGIGSIAYSPSVSLIALVIVAFETYVIFIYETVNKRQKKEIKKLENLLPICANCKKIRNENGFWTPIDNYLNEHAEMDFTHGYCPDCLKKLYPEHF